MTPMTATISPGRVAIFREIRRLAGVGYDCVAEGCDRLLRVRVSACGLCSLLKPFAYKTRPVRRIGTVVISRSTASDEVSTHTKT
ncbi:unnamed protein product, partial [Nesidiocoris tenuis]